MSLLARGHEIISTSYRKLQCDCRCENCICYHPMDNRLIMRPAHERGKNFGMPRLHVRFLVHLNFNRLPSCSWVIPKQLIRPPQLASPREIQFTSSFRTGSSAKTFTPDLLRQCSILRGPWFCRRYVALRRSGVPLDGIDNRKVSRPISYPIMIHSGSTAPHQQAVDDLI